MFYTNGQRSGLKGRKFRFLVTLKTKWKDFTTKKQQ
jgi:hypothetical protein